MSQEPPRSGSPIQLNDVIHQPQDQGVSIDIQDIIDDMKNQISELTYQNTLLRLTIKKLQ